MDSSRFCGRESVAFTIELERENDGRWLAEVPDLSGVMCYDADREEAIARVQALALRVIADRLEHREARRVLWTSRSKLREQLAGDESEACFRALRNIGWSVTVNLDRIAR